MCIRLVHIVFVCTSENSYNTHKNKKYCVVSYQFAVCVCVKWLCNDDVMVCT